MSAIGMRDYAQERQRLGVLIRGIAGVHRRIECGRIQHSSGIGVVAAEGVSGAPDGSLRHGTGAARLLLASCASNR